MKAYIAVFVCCSTHAIHLEVVSDLTTEAFLAALKRFVSRRGLPSDIFSDCGTNFVGANRELKKLLSQVLTQSHNQEVANQLSKDGISWHFNPPSAPHFGGLWESGVKSMKTHLYRIMGKEVWTFEQLSTAIAQIEAVLNSRPITPLSSDPTDFNALTPGHFLIGSPLTMIPEPDLTDVKFSRLSKWQQIQQMTQHFWRRWSSEYLTRLQHRPKWMDGEHPRQLEVGDMVLVKDENSPPAKWNLARVLAVHPGADSKVRVATIKTATSELKRPIVKLCLLPIDKSQS